MTTPEDIEKKLEASLLTNKVQTEVMAYVRDLANQVEALQADAERYRWLRQYNDLLWSSYCKNATTLNEFDAAIDAARKAK